MDELTILCIVIITLVSILFLKYSKRRNSPPGPVGWPLLGFYPFLGKNPVKTISRLGQKYGNVFGFYMGPQYVVILNEWNAMTEVFTKELGTYRPPELFADVPYKLGIGGANGLEWSLSRRLMSKAMKDIGMHRTKWEELVQEEVKELTERILQHGSGPLDVNAFFAVTFANNIVTLVLGKRLEAGHRLTQVISEAVDAIMESSGSMDMVNFSPRLRKLLEVLGFEKNFQLQEHVQQFSNFISSTVDDQSKNQDKNSDDSFIHLHHKDLENSPNLDTESRERLLKGDILSLIVGGSETTRTATIWALIAMADHPEAQGKVQEELDRELCGESITWADRMKIPYTHAAILEVLRWRTLAPFTALRIAVEDMKVQDYHISKGTFILFNVWAVHNDTKYWKEPQKYMPERFLTADGTKVNSSPESFAPFSHGKRNCPGKLIALMELLQYFTTLMKKFKVVPSSGNKAKYEERLGLTLQATNVNLCFIPRE